MPNQYVNKVVQSDGTTLIDISDSTAVASDVAQGKYFYLASGEKVQGAATGSGTAAISVVDTADSHGGTVRTITALDISDTTAVASDVAQGKYFYTADGTKTTGTASGGGTPSATKHTIHFEFSDSTDTDIDVYYDDTFVSSAITATTPTTYGGKTVDSAELDGVAWYTRPTETWETVYDGNISWYPDSENNYPYCWLSDLSSISIPDGSVWRITYNNVQYRCTAVSGKIGNPKWSGGTDDGSDVPFVFSNDGWGAWTGSLNAPNVDSTYYFKIEHLVSA